MEIPPNKRNKKPTKRHFSRAGCAISSISNSPEYTNKRSEVGHCEKPYLFDSQMPADKQPNFLLFTRK